MDARLKSIFQSIAATKKHSLPWERGDVVEQPRFRWDGRRWNAVQPDEAAADAAINQQHRLSVVSWNIDFMRSYPDQRMKAGARYLHEYVSNMSHPAVLMLSEMVVSDLELLQSQEWVRSSYDMTDVSTEFWESGYYGTCVLIPRELTVVRVFRIHYSDTSMERDALFVDTKIHSMTVRLCCTHLESLIADPPKRPGQLSQAANLMKQAEASIIAGDMNAIQSFDKTLHLENGLNDAYLEYGGVEDDEAGMTWGQMASTAERKRFGLSRMDKVLYFGALTLQHFETFGQGVVVEDLEQMKEEDGLDESWVTDHLGVRGDFLVHGIDQ